MAGITDVAGPALASAGGLGFLIWIARILLDDRAASRAADRPLARALAAVEKDRDAKIERIAELELEVDSLHDERNTARSDAAAANDRARSADAHAADLQRQLAAAHDELRDRPPHPKRPT